MLQSNVIEIVILEPMLKHTLMEGKLHCNVKTSWKLH